MALYSTGLRKAMMEGPGMKPALDDGKLRIFCAATDPANEAATAVAVPATADAAETGTLMMELTVNGDGVTGLTLEADGAGALTKPDSAVWQCSAPLHDGSIHYWRLVAAGDTGAQSTTECRMQGTIGTVHGAMKVSSHTVSKTRPWVLNVFLQTLPDSGDDL